jgi:uncharacterized protein (DUF924 family)
MDLRRRVLDFWFGPPGSAGYGEAQAIWFETDSAFDAEVRRRFEAEVENAARGGHDGMAADPEGALALVILLDQFPRNLYRGAARAFATDAKARRVAEQAIAAGHDRALAPFMRPFLYLPFEHSEAMADQERSVALFRALGDERSLAFAIGHRDVIARFGRFPHRNAALGRASTPEERAFLKQPGFDFSKPFPPAG